MFLIVILQYEKILRKDLTKRLKCGNIYLSKDKNILKEVEIMFTLVWLSIKGQFKKQVKSMLVLWAMQNLKSGYAVILDENKQVVEVYECQKQRVPKRIELEDFPFDITVA